MLVLASSIAITVENNLEQRNSAFIKKKLDKRGLDGLAYDWQEHQGHVYGPSVPPPPVYEVPAPDAAHPVPGYIPEPSPPVAVGHPVGS